MIIKKLNNLFHKHSRWLFGAFTIVIIVSFMIRPRLTTVDQQAEEIGRQAARLLLDRISGKGDIKRQEILIPARTILRQSSASDQNK